MAEKDSNDLEATICLKCGSQISHIPYRYNGQVFHARCLLCNACGRRLIGKPFITAGRQIFCGDKCQEAAQKDKSPKTSPVPPPLPFVNHHSEANFSEDRQFASTISLQDIYDSMPGVSRNTRPDLYSSPSLAPPTNGTVSRITDYPVSSSPMSNRSHSFRSETDSISTISESSFTSDSSSYTYDAHRKPKKKILKSSNAPKRHHKNRVRWNLNNLESVSDIDSVSMDSTSSYNSYVPATSHIHTQARDLTTRSLQNWKDYEHPLPPGSTGLTPNRTKGLSQSQQLYHTQPPPRLQYPNKISLYRTYSGDISPSHQSVGQHRVLHHVLSADSNQLLHNHSPPLHPQKSSSIPQAPKGKYTNGTILNVPVFHLDEDNLPELDESNMEDRKRRHIFQIPQQSRSTTTTTPLQTLQEDDKDDYDHLSPAHKVNQSLLLPTAQSLPIAQSSPKRTTQFVTTTRSLPTTQSSPIQRITLSPSTKRTSTQKTAQDLLAPVRTDEQWYSSEDIEEALQMINDSESPSDDELEQPPPIPPKQKAPPPPRRSSSLSNVSREMTDRVSMENTLHSPSMETLKNYDSSPLDDGLTPEVHPETPNSMTTDMGFSWGSPIKLKERIVEGAEDPHRNPSPIHTLQQAHSVSHLPSSTNNDIGHTSLIRHNSLSPKGHRSTTTHSSIDTTNLRRANTSPNDLSNSDSPILTKEDEAVVQWMKQPRAMKPVVVDTDKEIEQMMAEIGGGGKKNHHSVRSAFVSHSLTSKRQKYFGTCSVCNKIIESSQSLFSFASRLYHNKCFCCAQCGCPLRGKQIYTIKGTLVCTDDYNKITKSGSTHSLPAVTLKKDTTKDHVLLQKIVHNGSHMTNNGDHVIHRHNSTTMV